MIIYIIILTNKKNYYEMIKIMTVNIEQVVCEIGGYWDSLSDWEKKFMESITKQYQQKGRLSQKQEAVLERIANKKSDFGQNYDDFVGRGVKSWILKQKIGRWVKGATIATVKRISESGKAIACDIHIPGLRNLLVDVWIPISQLTEAEE